MYLFLWYLMRLQFHHLYIKMRFAAAPLSFISKNAFQDAEIPDKGIVHWWRYILTSVWTVGLGHFGSFLSLISEITAPAKHQCWLFGVQEREPFPEQNQIQIIKSVCHTMCQQGSELHSERWLWYIALLFHTATISCSVLIAKYTFPI